MALYELELRMKRDRTSRRGTSITIAQLHIGDPFDHTREQILAEVLTLITQQSQGLSDLSQFVLVENAEGLHDNYRGSILRGIEHLAHLYSVEPIARRHQLLYPFPILGVTMLVASRFRGAIVEWSQVVIETLPDVLDDFFDVYVYSVMRVFEELCANQWGVHSDDETASIRIMKEVRQQSGPLGEV